MFALGANIYRRIHKIVASTSSTLEQAIHVVLAVFHGVSGSSGNENGHRIFRAGATKNGRKYTNTRFCSKHALATSHTWLRTSRYIPSLPDAVRGLGGGRAKIPCPATSNVPGLSCKGSWLEGRSGVAGSGWVKWPQLDLHYFSLTELRH